MASEKGAPLSEYTRGEILKRTEENSGFGSLTYPGNSLLAIDLSHKMIQAEVARVQEEDSEAEPMWVSGTTGGIKLE